MDWVVLIAAGLLEAVWALALDRSNGFRKWKPVAVFVAALAASMAGLAYAMLTIAPGTAYAVWVGIGAATTVLYAIVAGLERASVMKLCCVVALIVGVVGLKVFG